jgi:hypothetical protein
MWIITAWPPVAGWPLWPCRSDTDAETLSSAGIGAYGALAWIIPRADAFTSLISVCLPLRAEVWIAVVVHPGDNWQADAGKHLLANIYRRKLTINDLVANCSIFATKCVRVSGRPKRLPRN